jgi:hypothetical protein
VLFCFDGINNITRPVLKKKENLMTCALYVRAPEDSTHIHAWPRTHGWWLMLVCSERRVLLARCWWLVCSVRKVLLAGG